MRALGALLATLLLVTMLAGCVGPAANESAPEGSPTPTASPTNTTVDPGPDDEPDPSGDPDPSTDPGASGDPDPSSEPEPEGETHTVTIGSGGALADYSPDPITIKVGDSVVWKNADSATHTATENGGDGFDTKSIAAGATSTAIVFDTAGTFTYYCKAHPNTMTGARVIVEA